MAGRWVSPGPTASFTNKSDRHNVTNILLKVVLNIMIETTICPIIIILYPELSSLLCYTTSLSTLILAVKIRENVKFQMSAELMKGYGQYMYAHVKV
jgi:hypothetical protein